jgi:hypothetical protein
LFGYATVIYDWDDLMRLLRASDLLDPEEVLKSVETRFAMLRNLTELEQNVITDAKSGRNEPLAERLRKEIRSMFEATSHD